MPYEKKEVRARLDAGGKPESPGELNYLISRLLDSYLNSNHSVR